ncbi:hypothetical protein ONZ45_g7912 [Pleurotus djamor]|nr:hypothetical protein ONZ45_g7912 [Pleurotus djamor]
MPALTESLLFLVLTATTILASSPALSSSESLIRRDPPGWTSQGCFTDAPGSRTLQGRFTIQPETMSVETCTSFCFGQGFNIAGVEFGIECYCDRALQRPGAPTDASECNMPCSGNEEETCGAPDRINIYKTDAPGPINAGVSIEKCIATCLNNGFTYAGMEFTNECYCGNSLTIGLPRPDSECSMTCQADRTEFCGARDRLTVYKAPRAPPPVIPPCEDKPFNLCCASVTEWSANIPLFEGCHYTAPSLSELDGISCGPRPRTGCRSDLVETCCVDFLPAAAVRLAPLAQHPSRMALGSSLDRSHTLVICYPGFNG